MGSTASTSTVTSQTSETNTITDSFNTAYGGIGNVSVMSGNMQLPVMLGTLALAAFVIFAVILKKK